jgi:hypothetical protein
MKKTLIALVSIICTSNFQLLAQTIYPSGVSGCVARWTFDSQKGASLNNITDESGNNNHGTNYNITATEGWKGLPYTAGQFNGTSSYGLVSHNTSLNCPSEITMISLVRFNSFNSQTCQYNQILSKGYPHFIAGNYGIGTGDAPFDGDCTIYSPSKIQLYSQVGNGNANYTAGNYLALNKWYFLATTITPTTVKSYVVFMDPTLKESSIYPVDSITGSYNIGANTQDISIGKHLNPQFQYYVDGAMDEVILFNRALSTTEIYSVYDYLYGSTTSVSNNTQEVKNIFVTANNGRCIINTKSPKFSYEIYNALGQVVSRKSNCSYIESIDLGKYATQLFFVKVLDEKNQVHHFKINL